MKVYLLKMTHIFIMFSDRIPFVNIEIVTLFVKKSRNNNIFYYGQIQLRAKIAQQLTGSKQ